MDQQSSAAETSSPLKKVDPHFIHKSHLKQLATQPRRLIIPVLAIFGTVLMISGGVVEYIKTSQNISEIKRSTVSEFHESTVAGAVRGKIVKVDIQGAVVQPGVREIPYNSRIDDVLNAAGGLSPKADRTYVSKNINLAQVVVDGMKIYIPSLGEAPVTTMSSNSVAKQTNSNPTLTPSMNINTASSEELERLSGVGPVTAQKIIQGRPYQTISDLQTKKIVSASVFAKIKDDITAP